MKKKKTSVPVKILLSSLTPDPKNPRSITADAAAGLATSLETFGDLGMVFNDRTGQWVSGHQRLAALKTAGATELLRTGDRGVITHPRTGERFPVRFVDWDETKQRKANLAANNPHIAGTFTDSALEQLQQLQSEPDFEALQFGNLLDQLADGNTSKNDVFHNPPSLEDFDITPPSKKTWILIATSADRAPEIENALAQFADDETRIEVSGGK